MNIKNSGTLGIGRSRSTLGTDPSSAVVGSLILNPLLGMSEDDGVGDCCFEFCFEETPRF